MYVRRRFHREYMEVKRTAEIRCIISPYRQCIPRCIEGEPVFYMEGFKAHGYGHIHNIKAWRLYYEDQRCTWHREGITFCNDVGHYPGECPCHKSFYL